LSHAEARSGADRRVDTLAKLRAVGADVWVSSASVSGGGSAHPYLVPLSLAWIDERVVVALDSGSRTARNIVEHRVARLALGHTRDVVIIDVLLDRVIDVADVPPDLAGAYADQAGWDPRADGGTSVYLVLRPDRIQAWREVNELPGRLLMRAGEWLA
jgi:hypothetical protein